MKKLVFIVNPSSASGKGKRTWLKVKRYLDKKGHPYDCFFTSRQGEAPEIVQHVLDGMASNIKKLVIIGGDGTIQEVMCGLPETEVSFPIGVICGGTGNDFARTIGQVKNPVKAIKQIINCNNKYKLDLGVFHTSSRKGNFINALGVGFDAEVGKKANESKMKHWLNKLGLGSLSYAIALSSLIMTFKRKEATITIDNQTYSFQNVWFITVANGPFYGGGMKISPKSITDDGLVNVIVVHQLSRLKLLALFGLVFIGKHLSLKEVSTFEGKEVTITCKEQMLVHADGESVGSTPVSASILHKKINIVK